jgi:hypothetical protein
MLFLALRLFGVVTQDITPPTFTVANDNLLCVKIIPDHRISTSSGKNFPFDLIDTGHTGCEEIFCIEDAEKVFSGMQSLYNWCQDFELELHNAGIYDQSFYQKN